MLITAEGRKVDKKNPLSEYPTPQFRRDSYMSLNGYWDFAINESEALPDVYDKTIVVPFAVETPLSGVGVRVKKTDVMHYRKSFMLPEGFKSGRVLLHFEAVDQICDVYLNGLKICHHEGGYAPFTVDLMELRTGMNTIQVEVKDDTDSDVFPRGKQMNNNKTIWYTPTSGIWQSVWIESVPNKVIQSLRFDPDFDSKTISIHAQVEGKIINASVDVFAENVKVGEAKLDENGNGVISLENAFHPWSPETPFLYDVDVKVDDDLIHSYFAMRKFSSIEVNGHKVFALNNKPYFLSGVLDQGYWPDGGLTPPTDEAYINDITLLKDMGFNMLRKHIKIENMRFYYHCDRLGMLVMQDFVSGGAPYKFLYIALRPFLNFNFEDTEASVIKKLGRENKASREFYITHMEETVKRLYNCPCIYGWTIFNEGWGQFETAKCFSHLLSLDNTRTIDANSGWYDQGVGDYCSRHIYFRKLKMKNDGKRILSLSEFGGYSWRIEGHCFASANFGYKGFKDKESLNAALKSLYEDQVYPLLSEGLSSLVYTQLSDVEEETNGLVTYDREIIKVDKSLMRSLNEKLHF